VDGKHACVEEYAREYANGKVSRIVSDDLGARHDRDRLLPYHAPHVADRSICEYLLVDSPNDPLGLPFLQIRDRHLYWVPYRQVLCLQVPYLQDLYLQDLYLLVLCLQGLYLRVLYLRVLDFFDLFPGHRVDLGLVR
jgi:hypothetical protein